MFALEVGDKTDSQKLDEMGMLEEPLIQRKPVEKSFVFSDLEAIHVKFELECIPVLKEIELILNASTNIICI